MPMRTLRLLAGLALGAGLVCGQALAQDTKAVAGQAYPEQALAARDAWYADQVLVRSAMRLDVRERGKDQAKTFWMFIERTPNGRSRVVIKDGIQSPTRMAFLVQDNANMAIAGEDVIAPAAAWMLGHYLFGQALEATMLLNWSMGLPGKDYSLDAEVAGVDVKDGALKGISQAGWQVAYGPWVQAGDGRPALPRQLRLVGDGAEVMVSVIQVETYDDAPEDYSEFKIM